MKTAYTILVSIAIAIALWAYAHATGPSTCQLTGNLVHLYGNNAINAKVYYKAIQSPQVPPGGGNVIPGGDICTATTDSNGNLPSTGNCSSFVQGECLIVTVGQSKPVNIQIPMMTTADLSTLILANTDPATLVSAIALAGPAFSNFSVVNPSAGNIGTTTITSPAAYTQNASNSAVVDIGVNGNIQQVVMQTSTVLMELQDFASGAFFVLDVTEDGTGGRTPSWQVPGGWTLVWSHRSSAPTLPLTTAGTHTFFAFVAISSSVLVGVMW